MMNNSILEQATAVFDTEEKWKAFHEIEIAVPSIIQGWLTVGANALREEFSKNRGSWKCSAWTKEWETRWYLEEFDEKSINLGIGWDTFSLYLFDGRGNTGTWRTVSALLGQPRFEQLISRIGAQSYDSTWHLLLANPHFDPFGPDDAGAFRARRIAWHAAHDTERFVEMTLHRIRQITEDDEMVRLIVELNNLSAATDGV